MTTENLTSNLKDVSHYHLFEAQSSSKLAAFYQSPDHALMETEPKGFFEIGKMFELLLQSYIQLKPELFFSQYHICNATGAIPDNLEQLISEKADFNEHLVKNKDGSLSKQSASKNSWFLAAMEKPGSFPVSVELFEQLETMVNNMLRMELIDGLPLSEMLKNASFQVPVIWEYEGIMKKALFDIICPMKTDNGIVLWHFDIKTAADLSQFKSMFKSKYWIQDRHYTQGLSITRGNCNNAMIFLVASKKEPYLSQAFYLDSEDIYDNNNEYDMLCNTYNQWRIDGKKPKGWLDMMPIRRKRFY